MNKEQERIITELERFLDVLGEIDRQSLIDLIEDIKNTLIAEVERCQHQMVKMCLDICDDEADIRKLCKSVLPESLVDGDSNGVPGIVGLVELLVNKIEELQETNQ